MSINRRKFTKLISAGTAATCNMGLVGNYRPDAFFLENANRQKLRAGIIGTGARGNWIARVAQDVEAIDIVACCDIFSPHLEQGLSLAAEGAIGYRDYRKLLDDRSIDAVIIATPLFLHFPMAMDAIEASKHVYCEKTMTYTADEALQLQAKVHSTDRIFQVGYQHRYNPLYQEIKFLIDQVYCGKIMQVKATWNRNGDWRRPVPDNKVDDLPGYPDLEHLINWRMYRAYSGGLMAELCSHQIDIVNWMLGCCPDKVVGIGGVDYWKDGRETFDNVHAVFAYPDGMKASFTAVTTNAKEGYSIQFLGDRGTIEVKGEQGHRAKIYAENFDADKKVDGISGATEIAWEKQEGIPVRVENAATDDFLPTENALTHFAECIAHREQPLINVDAGCQAASCVHRANTVLRQNITEY